MLVFREWSCDKKNLRFLCTCLAPSTILSLSALNSLYFYFPEGEKEKAKHKKQVKKEEILTDMFIMRCCSHTWKFPRRGFIKFSRVFKLFPLDLVEHHNRSRGVVCPRGMLTIDIDLCHRRKTKQNTFTSVMKTDTHVIFPFRCLLSFNRNFWNCNLFQLY